MKYTIKLSARVIIPVIIGILFAGALTKITYPCAPVDGAAGCVLLDKAAMHPRDLLNNKQDSLIHFSENFVVASLVSFALLSAFRSAQKRSRQHN